MGNKGSLPYKYKSKSSPFAMFIKDVPKIRKYNPPKYYNHTRRSKHSSNQGIFGLYKKSRKHRFNFP